MGELAAVGRTRPDRCPGILRPWPAEDGPLVRIRLVGGLLSAVQFEGLLRLSREYGDGNLHLTSRANVQVRAVRDPAAFADELEALGLLPSRSHERVRNIVVSPTGSLHGLARDFDALLCATPSLAGLPARFLFGFDDCGDLGPLSPDLGVYVADGVARLVVGGRLGDIVALDDVPNRLVELALRFLTLRGEGPTAAWHVAELPVELAAAALEYPVTAAPPPMAIPDGVLTPDLAARLDVREQLVVTPWRGVIPS
ncbi:MAG TPA: nitrite reductase [Nocardioidaceae bacterium]|nr:nitrite reductase [Nocardioidaceae bacterium]